MSAPPPNLSRVSLAVLLAAASAACAPEPMTDATTATRVPAPAPVPDPAPTTAGDAPGDSRACNVARVDALAGHAATPPNLDLARELSGADSVRVIHPGDAVTEDYRASRLNLEVDGDDVILRAACG